MAQKNKPDYELLKDAVVILEGVPEAAIAFGPPCSKQGASIMEGTVCAPEGWLSLHPTFMALGLGMVEDCSALQYRGERGSVGSVMANIFGIPEEEAAQLFGERQIFGDGAGKSDKQLWDEKVRQYLREKEEVTDREPAAEVPFAPPANTDTGNQPAV